MIGPQSTAAKSTTIAKPHWGFEFALLALLALLWGSSYLLIKIAVASIPPFTLIAMRVAVAAAFLLAVMGVASQSYLRSGVSVLLGVAVLGEQITPMVGFGLLATIVGVAAINVRVR